MTSTTNQPAGTQRAGQEAGSLFVNGSRQYKRLRKIISATADGDNTIVAAVAGYSICVMNYTIISDGASTGTLWKSGSTPISGAMPFADGGGCSPLDGNWGVLETAPGEALVLNNPTGVDTVGHLTYVLVQAEV